METKKFCENCGNKLNEKGYCDNCKNNLPQKKETHVVRTIFDVIRYIIGSLFILANLFNNDLLGVLFGLSLFPVIYRTIIPNNFNVKNKNNLITLAIMVPFIIFILWIFLMPVNNETENNNPNNENQTQTETEEDNKENEKENEDSKTLSSLRLHLPSNASLEEYSKNTEDRFDVKIKYTKSSMSSYSCASDSQSYAKYYLGNNKINSIQFECVNDSGTFMFVNSENLYSIDSTNLESNTKYFDGSYNQIETSLEQLNALRVQEFKNSCSTYDYKDVLRNPDNYVNSNAYWFGEIVQVISKNSNYSVFRVDVSCEKLTYSQGYICSDTIYVTYYGDQSFIEDDYVKMWGTMNGTETYTTVLGASVTIPKFSALYMELQ